ELIIDTSDESSPVFFFFYAVPISGTVPLSVNFHNLSENGTEYVWRFGNGITSTLVAPVYTYTQTGVYTVTLTGTGPGGEDTEVKTNYITVYDTIPPTHTPTPTAMPTLTSTATSTNTPAPTQTLTPTTTSTNTPLPTTTNTPAPTETITPTATSTNTPLPTNTATMAPTITSTATSTAVPTITPIPTQEPPIDDTIGISPTVKTVAVGDLFTVTVEMYNLETAVSGYQFDLSYDDTLLQLETVTDGTFFEGFGQDTVCPEWVEPTSSSLRLACVGVGPNAGATGNGRLATLTFLALDNGLTDLTLSAIQLADTAVPAAPVTIDVQQGIIVITESSAAATALVDDASGNGTGGIFSAAWWSTTWQNVDETAVIFTIALSILLVALLYLDRQRQLRYLWRIIVSLSLILQVIVYVPTPIRAAGADSAAGIDGKRPLRSTETLMPPVLPEATTSLGCYDADLDCDKDVDEADVTTASPHWDCDNSAACYDVDADIDDNNIIDVFDLAWVTNDYDILPPEITIDSPTEGAVVTGANLTVSGQLSDQHQISEVTVNGTTAQLTGNAFSVQLPVESGNFVLDVIAEDEIGQFEIASRVVMADQSGPLIKIEVPANRQAVYILNPTVEVVYGDFLSAVDSSSFMAELKDSTNTVVQSFNSTVAGSESAQFSLATLSTDQTYTLTATIADAHGNSSMTSSSFFVTPDTAIVPPTVPQNPGWISGRVYDSASCNEHLTTCDGLAGVQVTIMQVDPDALTTVRDDRADFYESEGALNGAFPAGSADVVDEYATAVNGTILTGPDGFYAFPVDTTGVYHLRFEKDNYTYGQREVTAVRERSTAVNELYLTAIDSALTLCDSTGCFHTSADGQMTVDIPEDAIPVGEQVEVTATEFDRVFFLPSGQLPPGTGETFAFNLGGNSDYEFQKPITVSLKNSRGFDPGMVIPLGYWNQHTLQWEHEGVATVDDTGEWVVMQVTHFSNHDPNFPFLRPSEFDMDTTNRTENDDPCADGESGCFINLQSGTLREWIDLPMVNVAGASAGPQLAYNTERANPSSVIDVEFLVETVGNIIADQVIWELYIEGEKTDTITFAADLSIEGEVGRYRYYWDGRNALDEQLPPGVYAYAVKISVPYEAEYCFASNAFGWFSCEAGGNGTFTTQVLDQWVYGEVALNTQQESSLGAGWVLQGQQSIYEDEAGRILIAEDDALTQYYFDFKDLLSGAAAYSAAQPTVVGPASVDFPVTEISGGTVVSGIININTTWTMAQSPYVI
ncbi:MAG: hypothetical protein GY943_16620, partial [Chloroflexi bacterium]|nr:hypothetical protein [Chloroflexota bacterium]